MRLMEEILEIVIWVIIGMIVGGFALMLLIYLLAKTLLGNDVFKELYGWDGENEKKENEK